MQLLHAYESERSVYLPIWSPNTREGRPLWQTTTSLPLTVTEEGFTLLTCLPPYLCTPMSIGTWQCDLILPNVSATIWELAVMHKSLSLLAILLPLHPKAEMPFFLCSSVAVL